jgi:hypothetical protein
MPSSASPTNSQKEAGDSLLFSWHHARMKTHPHLLALMFAAAVFAQTTADMSKTNTMSFYRDASVLDEHRSLGKQVDDFQQTFPAVKIDPKAMTAVKTTAEFRLDGQPLLWFAADKSKAVLDEHVFGELTMVNVTTMGEGKTAVVGKIKEPGGTLAPRAVAWFLMRSGILQTFVHLESTVKLDGEKKRWRPLRGGFFRQTSLLHQ